MSVIETIKVSDMEITNKNAPELTNSFYDKFDPQIRGIVARILTSANQYGDIEDCVNTVYLELTAKLQQYNETRGSMGAFVAVVARSAALDYCKSSTRKSSELVGDEKLDFLKEPVEVEDKVEFQELVDGILEKLSDQEGILFTMRYILFYSPGEIAKAFKIKRNAVDARLNRLKSKLKKLLKEGGVII